MRKRIIGAVVAIFMLINSFSVYAAGSIYEKDYTFDFLDSTKPGEIFVLLTSDRVDLLNDVFENDEDEKAYFMTYIDKAKKFTQATPYSESSDQEESWIRGEGNAMLDLAFGGLMTKDQQFVTNFVNYVEGVGAYPSWGKLGPDLPHAHILLSLACGYNWMYDLYTPEQKAKVYDLLYRKTIEMYEYWKTGQRWAPQILQNHHWIDITALTAAAIALYHDHKEEMREILCDCIADYERVFSIMSLDGFWHEGYGYGFYGMEWVLMYVQLAKTALGQDYSHCGAMKYTRNFILHMLLPENSISQNNVNFPWEKDGSGDWGLDNGVIRFFAATYQDRVMQSIGDLFCDNPNIKSYRYFKYYLWNDFDLEPLSPAEADEDTFHYFDDIGYVFSRTDWSGDETALSYRCGPPLGHEAVKRDDYYDWGMFHTDPDQNSFMLYGYGQWLIKEKNASMKLTENHNSLLINNGGQMGNNKSYAFGSTDFIMMKEDAASEIEKVVDMPEYTYIVGNAAKAYHPETGLKKFRRHMLFLKPDILIVLDDIELEKEADLELRFHPSIQTATKLGDGSYIQSGKTAKFKYTPLYTDGADIKVENVLTYFEKENGSDAVDELKFRVMKNNTKSLLSVSAFSASDVTEYPASVECERGADGEFVITSNGQVTVLNTKTKSVSVSGSKRTGSNLIKIKYNDALLLLGGETGDDGSTLVDLESLISELKTMGISCDIKASYNSELRRIDITSGDKALTLFDGENVMMSEGKEIYVSSPRVEDGKLFVPIRAVFEALGYRIDWSEKNSTVYIFDETIIGNSSDADLAAIYMNNKAVLGFAPDISEYYMERNWAGGAPIEAVAVNRFATIKSETALDDPSLSTITVTSADKTTTKTYILHTVPYFGKGGVGINNLTSSVEDTKMESRLFNYNVSDYFYSKGTDQWVELEFDDARMVSGVGIAWHVGYLRTAYFDILVSEDGKNWEPVLENVESSGTTNELEVYSFPSTRAKYLRVMGKGNSQNNMNSMINLAVYTDGLYITDGVLELENGESTVFANEPVQVKPVVKLSNGETARDDELEVLYYSSNPEIISIDNTGVARYVSEGIATISAVIKYNDITKFVEKKLSAGYRTYNIYPTDDVHVMLHMPTTNYNTKFDNGATVPVENIEVMGSTNGAERQAFLKFPVSDVDGTIRKAQVRIYGGTGARSQGRQKWGIRGCYSSDWNENSLIWITRPPYTEFLDEKLVGAGYAEWVYFDVTDYLKNELSTKKDNVSFAITSVEQNNIHGSFKSREVIETRRPCLIIETE